VPVPDVRCKAVSGPDEKLSFECEPRSGERSIAWGVSPGTKVKRKNEPRSGDRNLELKAVSHIAVISVPLVSLAQERSVAPSEGFLSNIRPYPGAHAPGYEYAAPPALKLRRHSGGCSLRYLLGRQPRPGRDRFRVQGAGCRVQGAGCRVQQKLSSVSLLSRGGVGWVHLVSTRLPGISIFNVGHRRMYR
jgi:hypothetical protein